MQIVEKHWVEVLRSVSDLLLQLSHLAFPFLPVPFYLLYLVLKFHLQYLLVSPLILKFLLVLVHIGFQSFYDLSVALENRKGLLVAGLDGAPFEFLGAEFIVDLLVGLCGSDLHFF